MVAQSRLHRNENSVSVMCPVAVHSAWCFHFERLLELFGLEIRSVVWTLSLLENVLLDQIYWLAWAVHFAGNYLNAGIGFVLFVGFAVDCSMDLLHSVFTVFSS